MRYFTKDEKYEYVKMITEGEISLTQLSKNNDLSLGMLSTWVKRYQEGGIEALENKKKAWQSTVEVSKEKVTHTYGTT